MTRKPPKTAVVAIKVEEELADILNRLPNKSAFIRKAIVAQLGMSCPLCQGDGIVPKGVHDHYAALIGELNRRACDGCGDNLPLPQATGDLSDADRARLEQFFHGGPLYCDDCFDRSPACEDCGWHVAEDGREEHRRRIHPEEN